MDNGFNLKKDRITFDCMPEDMQMSDAGFNALMGCTILWGLVCNFFICMCMYIIQSHLNGSIKVRNKVFIFIYKTISC